MSAHCGPLLSSWFTVQLALLEHDVTPRALLLLLRLLQHRNNQTGLCHPGEELLAIALNCSTRTIRNCLRELERVGLVKTRKGSECPPRNYYEIKLFVGSVPDYNKAEKNCLNRRKISSGKKENEPEKYRNYQSAKRFQLISMLGTSTQERETNLAERQELDQIIAETPGGGELGWTRLMALDAELVAHAYADGCKKKKSMRDIAQKLLADLNDAAGVPGVGQ